MVSPFSTNDLKQVETQLANQSDPEKRLLLLDELAGYFVFTNVQKATTLLEEQAAILQAVSNPDIQLNFHIHSALVENQLYNYETSEQHFIAARELVIERGNIEQQAEILIDYAGTTINMAKYDITFQLLEKASKLLEVFPDDRLNARITCREGILNLHVSNYPRAIELLLQAKRKISLLGTQQLQLKDYYFLTIINSGLGTIYQQIGDVEKSVRANLNVLEICQKTGMKSRLSWHYLNIGRGYIALNKIEEAEAYFKKAIKITDDSSQSSRAGAYANLGYCYYLKSDFEEALKLYDRAEKLYKQETEGNLTNLFVIENWRSELYAEIEENELAQKHLIKAFEYAKENQNWHQLSIICKEIAEFYKEIDDYKNAYEYLLLHVDMLDRYQEELNKRAMLEMEVKYEVEKRKQEAELLRLQATSLQLKALRAQMNPHFMYNALNSIQHYITSNEVTSAAKYLAKFAKLMRQSLDYSELEFISLEKELAFLEDYLIINQKLRFEDQLDFKINIDDEIEEDIMGVPTMIVQPYVENAIEHGLRTKKNGLVKLEFYLKDDNTILCIVEDNGIGRQKARELQRQDLYLKPHNSKGTNITEQRLYLLHKNRNDNEVYVKTLDLVNEDTGEALGTRVEIQIPIIEIQMKI